MPSTATVRGALAPADVVRVAALVSLVVATVTLGGIAGALFLLVLGGVAVPRALALPAPLDVAYGTSLLFAAWASQLEWYDAVDWLDLAVHLVCTGLIAAVAYLALVRWELLAGPSAAFPARASAGVVVVTTGLGAIGAILWEVGEWAGHTYLDDGIGVGYDDTVTDLAAGLVGATVAGAVLARRHRRAEVRS
ncbi:hypothetical protein V5D56_14310 [Cellulosimicrobium sp. PMB13]|uniref:hypothetical protein n=1 Tax=Cellulosimicrobium sp. PMB13 TaxID=3120158 RepID=UPI003F4C9CA6